ncbi:PREDICTED: trafficking protein particle complex subunit 4-like [Amphimedon queenslandica]|uniref:Trafficking protein particle complex subunit n=1 Tax=Amphimedon queenslandica TaxID=400682 RepID=A0A1X7UE51_AMPQE|nr:PREDICTED: trafficking protein particle complex subunit 4-like [Amphimedon queenslandica]|eukprot:XP_003388300.1 PREDICTED: trafficking protein particle complex subunit 4-like [Amphimedon queenslandica]
MGIYSVYIISKAGGLIFSHDMSYPQGEGEVEYSRYPVQGLVLEEVDRNIMLKYGEVQNPEITGQPVIQVGYSLVSINGEPVVNKCLPDGRTALSVIDDPSSFPIKLKFKRLKASINERIMLMSMLHSIYAISVRLSPEEGSKGIQCLEAQHYNINCTQTRTGVKFIVVAGKSQPKVPELLRKIYELYSDYVLKNPFYSLDMPIKCELFTANLVKVLDSYERERGSIYSTTTANN